MPNMNFMFMQVSTRVHVVHNVLYYILFSGERCRFARFVLPSCASCVARDSVRIAFWRALWRTYVSRTTCLINDMHTSTNNCGLHGERLSRQSDWRRGQAFLWIFSIREGRSAAVKAWNSCQWAKSTITYWLPTVYAGYCVFPTPWTSESLRVVFAIVSVSVTCHSMRIVALFFYWLTPSTSWRYFMTISTIG